MSRTKNIEHDDVELTYLVADLKPEDKQEHTEVTQLGELTLKYISPSCKEAVNLDPGKKHKITLYSN